MYQITKLKKELIHYDRIAFVFLIIVLGYFLIFLIITRFALGIVNFESLRATVFSEIFTYSFYIIFFASFIFLIYPAYKAYRIRRDIYEIKSPEIVEQYRLGTIFAVIIFLSFMALIFWISDQYHFGSVIELIILDLIALGITFGAYALGARGLDLPRTRKST